MNEIQNKKLNRIRDYLIQASELLNPAGSRKEEAVQVIIEMCVDGLQEVTDEQN